jgi:hypothetical protein
MQSSESQSLPLNVSGVRKFSNWRSIRSKIVAIALGLIVLMIVTSILSMLMSKKVGVLLDELTYRYIPAYSHLARANVHSLERALALRRMVIAKTQVPPDEEGYKARLKTFNERNVEIQRETEAARKLINAIIDDVSTPSDNAALGRIDARIESAVAELRGRFADEESKLLGALDAGDFVEARQSLGRLDDLRDEFIEKIDAIRSEMLSQVYASTSTVIRNQRETLAVSAIVTGLAATLGLGCVPRLWRHHSTRKATAGGNAGNRGGPFGQIAHSIDKRRDRRVVRGLQSYGRTVAPESAHQRNFWSVHRSEDR